MDEFDKCTFCGKKGTIANKGRSSEAKEEYLKQNKIKAYVKYWKIWLEKRDMIHFCKKCYHVWSDQADFDSHVPINAILFFRVCDKFSAEQISILLDKKISFVNKYINIVDGMFCRKRLEDYN